MYTQWAWKGVKLTKLMSIFSSKKVLEIFDKNSAGKTWSKKNNGWKVPSLMPIKVKGAFLFLRGKLIRKLFVKLLGFSLISTYFSIHYISKPTVITHAFCDWWIFACVWRDFHTLKTSSSNCRQMVEQFMETYNNAPSERFSPHCVKHGLSNSANFFFCQAL
jgi:hypothetical protein